MFDLNPAEERVLGCLLEKQRTTPDAYPLTLNSLRLACNQSTNRDPVVNYSEDFVFATLQTLHAKQLTRVAGGHGSRASKYRHQLEDELGISDDEASVICVLLLRGPQTPGELKLRSERMHRFDDLSDLDDTLDALTRRGLAERLERRPGEKQVRYRHLFNNSADGEPAAGGNLDTHEEAAIDTAPVAETPPSPVASSPGDSAFDALAAEMTDLRNEVDTLRREVATLRSAVADLRD